MSRSVGDGMSEAARQTALRRSAPMAQHPLDRRATTEIALMLASRTEDRRTAVPGGLLGCQTGSTLRIAWSIAAESADMADGSRISALDDPA